VIKRHYTDVEEEISGLAGAKGCTVRWLITKEQGAKRYAMRLFTLQPGGQIPLHEHEATEHEIFIIEGRGMLDDGSTTIPVKKGDAIFVPTCEKHSFINNTEQSMQFICIIPI